MLGGWLVERSFVKHLASFIGDVLEKNDTSADLALVELMVYEYFESVAPVIAQKVFEELKNRGVRVVVEDGM